MATDYMRIDSRYPIQSVEVVKVIRTTTNVGDGSKENPCRLLTQYWDQEGQPLFEDDPCAEFRRPLPSL